MNQVFAGSVADSRDFVLRRSVYIALALMYFAQGLPTGLAFNALGALIRQAGYGIAEVGLTGIAFLPWAFKFLWAGPVDNACVRWGQGRVVLVTQLLAVIACLALVPFAPGTHLHAALAGIVLLNTLGATQDIATNGYAVSRLQGKTAGPANAIQVAAFIVGMLVGGGGVLVLHEAIGWAGAMAAMAALQLALYFLLLLGRRWRDLNPAARGLPKVRLRDVRQHPDLGWALLIAIAFKFAGTAASTLAQPWLVDQGFSLEQIGFLQMCTLVATAAGGMLIGIPLVRRYGNRRAVLIGCALAAVLMGVPWCLNALGTHAPWVYVAALGVQALAEGAMYVAIWALFMNWASPARPGTDFTVVQCCESLTNALAAGAIGGLGQRWGYGPAFAFAWVAAVMGVAVIALALRGLRLKQPKGAP